MKDFRKRDNAPAKNLGSEGSRKGVHKEVRMNDIRHHDRGGIAQQKTDYVGHDYAGRRKLRTEHLPDTDQKRHGDSQDGKEQFIFHSTHAAHKGHSSMKHRKNMDYPSDPRLSHKQFNKTPRR